jgi:HK97 gp10 family phage protein
MTTITVTIKNADEIKEAFKQAPIKIIKNLNFAIGRIILQVESDAKKEAPVGPTHTGEQTASNMVGTIHSKMTGPLMGMVYVESPYAIFVHEGTRPHIIRAVNKKVLANKRTGQIFGKIVHHPGSRANPFLQRAVDKNESFIDQRFAEVVENIL